MDNVRMTVLPSGALEIDDIIASDKGSYRCNVTDNNQYRYLLSNLFVYLDFNFIL